MTTFCIGLNTLKALAMYANNPRRQIINGVIIDCSGIEPVAVSTDDHRLLAVRLDNQDQKSDYKSACMLPYPVVKQALAMKSPQYALIVSGNDWTIQAINANMNGHIVDSTIDWRRVIPKSTTGESELLFNAQYLADAVTVHRLVTGDSLFTACFSTNGRQGAIWAGAEHLQVLMPTVDEIQGGITRPHWIEYN